MKFADYKTAKMLDELGYDGEWTHWWVIRPWSQPSLEFASGALDAFPDGTDVYSAPRLDDVAYWLKEEHGMGIYPYDVSETSSSCYLNGNFRLMQSKWVIRDGADLLKRNFSRFDDALEAGVKKALEILIDVYYPNFEI